jgi:hypothetical protein
MVEERMGVRYTIDTIDRIVSISTDGALTAEEFRDCIAILMQDPKVKRGYHFICICTSDRKLERLDCETLTATIQANAPKLMPCRCAVVVPTEDSFATIVMWNLLAPDGGVMLAPFTTGERARNWVLNG